MVVAFAEEDALAVPIDAQHLRILARHPRRTCAGGRRQIDAHACGVEIIDDFGHPVQVILALFGLERGPGKDAQRYDVDVCFFHQLDILCKDIRAMQPLVGIIVRAIAKNGIGHRKNSFLK